MRTKRTKEYPKTASPQICCHKDRLCNKLKIIAMKSGLINFLFSFILVLLIFNCTSDTESPKNLNLTIQVLGNPQCRKAKSAEIVENFSSQQSCHMGCKCNCLYDQFFIYFSNASHNTSTGCSTFRPVPSSMWWRHDVPGAAIISSEPDFRTAGKISISPICILNS